MKQISSIEQYYGLIDYIKSLKENYLSNIYLSSELVNQYISKGLLYFTQSENSLQLYIEHEKYYEMLFMYPNGFHFEVNILDKPILSNVILSEDELDSDINDNLTKLGFTLISKQCGLSYDPQEVLQNINETAEYLSSELREGGFRMITPDLRHYKQLREFVEGVKELHFWDVERNSEKEYLQDCKDNLVNVIIDKNGNICAANYAYIYGKHEYGWVAVAEEYRKTYGMAVVLTRKKMQDMINRKHMGTGWVSCDNTRSLRYHIGIGEKPNGRYKYQYLLEGVKLS